MSELVSLSAELRRLHNTLARPLENAIQVAAGLEALDGENKRLTEKHRELEQAYTALQVTHDTKRAALEKTFIERLLTLEDTHAKRQAELDAATTARQERAERAKAHFQAIETEVARAQERLAAGKRETQQNLVTMQVELDAVRQTLAAEKDELEKYRKHMRAVLDRVTT